MWWRGVFSYVGNDYAALEPISGDRNWRHSGNVVKKQSLSPLFE